MMRSKTYKEKGLQINMYGGRDVTFTLYVKKDFFGVEGAKAIRSTVEGVIDVTIAYALKNSGFFLKKYWKIIEL